MRRLISGIYWGATFFVPWVILLIIPEPVWGDGERVPEANIAEPFLEIRTGPGRGFPVFYIAEKGETVFILKRRVDWYKIKLSNEKQGWVHRKDIEKTLRVSGRRKSFTERIFDSYISNRFEMGLGAGTFGGDPIIIFRGTYHLTDFLGMEGSAGFASGDLGGTDIFQGGLILTPWRNRWVSFFATIGGGFIHVEPTSLLVKPSEDTSPAAYAGLGFTVPLFRNLMIRGDFRNATVFKDTVRTQEFQEYSMGLSFRF